MQRICRLCDLSSEPRAKRAIVEHRTVVDYRGGGRGGQGGDCPPNSSRGAQRISGARAKSRAKNLFSHAPILNLSAIVS